MSLWNPDGAEASPRSYTWTTCHVSGDLWDSGCFRAAGDKNMQGWFCRVIWHLPSNSTALHYLVRRSPLRNQHLTRILEVNAMTLRLLSLPSAIRDTRTMLWGAQYGCLNSLWGTLETSSCTTRSSESSLLATDLLSFWLFTPCMYSSVSSNPQENNCKNSLSMTRLVLVDSNVASIHCRLNQLVCSFRPGTMSYWIVVRG